MKVVGSDRAKLFAYTISLLPEMNSFCFCHMDGRYLNKACDCLHGTN